MKRLLVIILLISGLGAKGQFVSPYASSAGSSEIQGGNIRMSVSIGQLMHTGVVAKPGGGVAQGVFGNASLIKGQKELEKKEHLHVELDVYPNPAVNLVHVNISEKNEVADKGYRVELYDMFGRLAITKHKIFNGRKAELQLKMHGFKPGQYLIRVLEEDTGTAVARFKLVKVQAKR